MTEGSGVTLVGTSTGGGFNNLVLNGNVDLTAAGAKLSISNGLTLNGTVSVGNSAGTTSATVAFTNTETVGGNGGFLLGGSASNALSSTGTTTFGPNLLIHGKNGSFGGGSINNQGTVTADITGGTFFINEVWTNYGTLSASAGTVNLGNPTIFATWTNNGTFGASNGGTLSLTGDGTWSSTIPLVGTGGTVNFTRMVTNSGTLTLSGNGTYLITQSYYTGGAGILTGTVTEVNGASLSTDAHGGTLQGVTLNGDFAFAAANSQLAVTGGLTLNGTMKLGNDAGTTYGTVNFTGGNETIGGSGSILFGSAASILQNIGGYPTGTTVTLGPNLTVHGKNGYLGVSGSQIGTFANQGTISADVAGGTIQIGIGNMSFTNTGTVKAQGGGTLALNAVWTNTAGTFSADGGTINIIQTGTNTSGYTGTVEAKNGGTVNFGTNSSCFLTNTGATLLLTGSGSFRLGSGSITGGTVTESSGAVLTEAGPGYSLYGITLNGNLDMTQLNTQMDVYNGLTLNGTISVGNSAGTTSGQLFFDSIGTLSGTGDILFGGSSGNVVSSLGSGSVTIGSGIKVHGKTGYAGLPGGYSIQVNQGTIAADVAGGTITVTIGFGGSNSGTLAANGGSLSVSGVSGSNWTNTGTVKADGTVVTVTGTWTNNGTVLAQNGGTLSASTPTNYANGTLTGGTWQVFAGSTLRVTMSSGIVTNAATILMDGANSNFYRDSGTTNALASFATNNGSFTVQNGRTFSSPAAFSNAGALSIGAGSTFTATGAYTQTAGSTTLSGGTLAATGGVRLQGGSLSGAGTVNGDVTNAAVVSPGTASSAGLLTVNGNYTQTSAGTLNVKLGGLSAGTQFDRLAVSGAAALDGALNVTEFGGFSPADGNAFLFLPFGSRGGDFAVKTGFGPGAGVFLRETEHAADLTLEAFKAQLLVVQQPGDTTAGQAISPAVQVAIVDPATNTPIAFDNTDTVALAIGTNPGGGTLSGTLTQTVSGGIATFADLSIDKAGSGYTLVANGAGLPALTSAGFAINPAAADHLVFLQQPTDTAAGQTISAVIVQVVDQFGNVVTSDNTDTITLSIGNNPSGGTLSGTLTVRVVNGVATFSDLSIDLAGMGYTLHATVGGALPDVDSNPFNVL